MCMERKLATIKKTLCVVVAFGLSAASAHGQLVINPATVQSGGVVDGPSGAAVLLGLKPSTLRSRMKRLGVHRRPSA